MYYFKSGGAFRTAHTVLVDEMPGPSGSGPSTASETPGPSTSREVPGPSGIAVERVPSPGVAVLNMQGPSVAGGVTRSPSRDADVEPSSSVGKFGDGFLPIRRPPAPISCWTSGDYSADDLTATGDDYEDNNHVIYFCLIPFLPSTFTHSAGF